MPGPLITRQDIANGAVSGQPRNFDSFGGKARAARVFFYFPTALRATAMPHSLGRTPSSWRVVHVSKDGTPGAIFSPVQGTSGGANTKLSSQYTMSKNFIVLACETANTWAEIELS